MNNHMTETSRDYFEALSAAIQLIDRVLIKKAVGILKEAKERDSRIYTFGNGGSAATAIHFANDLVKMAGMKAQALTNISILTAYANDEEYSLCFESPLKVLMQDGDIALGISCSGRSSNFIKALEFAKGRGNTTIALLGSDLLTIPVDIYELMDAVVFAPSDVLQIQEDLHLAICHVIAGYLTSH